MRLIGQEATTGGLQPRTAVHAWLLLSILSKTSRSFGRYAARPKSVASVTYCCCYGGGLSWLDGLPQNMLAASSPCHQSLQPGCILH
jgi:hypothetical protein